MIKKNIFFFLLVSIAYITHAQATPYLIPRQIFVGDTAVLVIPLEAAEQNYADVVLTPQANNFPLDVNIDFHRILLEQRVTGSRFMIEFTAFIPGIVELPVIEIGGKYFSGITVNVNSVIDSRASLILSQAASTLAMPGTLFMLYGSLTASILLIIAIVWFFLKGQRFLNRILEKWRRYRLFKSMYKTERRLYKALQKGEDKRIILDKISDELRIFLSVLTGNNCLAMTAFEFSSDPFLYKFFRSCDDFRFSGADFNSQNVLTLLDDLRLFINTLEKEKQTGEEKAA